MNIAKVVKWYRHWKQVRHIYKMWTLQPNSGAVTIFVVLIRSTKALCCCRLKSKVNVKLLSWQVSKLELCIAGTNMSVGYLVWNFVWAAKPWVMHQVYIPASKQCLEHKTPIKKEHAQEGQTFSEFESDWGHCAMSLDKTMFTTS